MKSLTGATRDRPDLPRRRRFASLVMGFGLGLLASQASAADTNSIASPGQAGKPFASVPEIAPIGVHVEKYFDVLETSKGPAIDPAKGYRTERLGRGLYMVTNNRHQSMLMVYESGVVVMDAPPGYAPKILQAIAEVSDKPITHVIYSHSHYDHIGGVNVLGGHPVIIAQEETKKLLIRAHDPRRPIPTKTFKEKYTLKLGSQALELSYHGNGHEPGNIFIYAPEQKTLMMIDVIFPDWIPFRRFGVAQDIPGYFQQVKEIDALPWEKLVAGHVTRIGTHDDVKTQIEFNGDVMAAAKKALETTKPIDEINPADLENPWAVGQNFTARVASQCVMAMTPKWKGRLAGFDTFIWDQCYAIEQSIRID